MSEPASTPAPAGKLRTLVRRTASTLGLWAVVSLGLLSQKAGAYLGLISLLALIGVIEWFRMLKAAKVPAFGCLGIAASIVYAVVFDWMLLKGADSSHFFTFDAAMVFVVVAGAFTWQLKYPIKGLESLTSVAMTALGFIYAVVMFHFAARLVFVVPQPDGVAASEVPGSIVLLWVIAVTKFTDMGAYLTGTAIGKHKMIPHVSPGKTWEGFVGALFFAQLAGCGLYALMPKHLAVLGGWHHVILLGLILALLAVVGDLAESVVKRALGAKDSGNMLPGIGGALDLIDSLCFTTPFLYFYLKWVLL